MAQTLSDGPGFELKNVVVSTVKPSEKVPHAEKYDAALFDLYLPDFYVPVVWLYRPDKDQQIRLSGLEFITRLKQSLSKLLTQYYTFAGRYCKTYDTRIRELLCNDEGVPFIEAEIDEEMDKLVNLDDFQGLPILSGYEFLDLDPKAFYQVDADFLLPACFIQVTKFRCGGMSLNATFCHEVGDGKAMFQFMKDWSQMTLEGYNSNEPVHDRSLTYPVRLLLEFMAPEKPEVEHTQNTKKGNDSSSVDNKFIVSGENDRSMASKKSSSGSTRADTVTSTNGTDVRDLAAVDMAAAFLFPILPEGTHKTLHVRRESVQKLKQKAMDTKKEIVPTTLDCIQSCIWRGVSSIPTSVDNRRGTYYGIVAEGRNRLHDPPLPDSYAGNAFHLLYTQPLDEPSDDPLIEASIIHQMVKSVTPHVWLPQLARSMGILLNSWTSDERSIFVTSWYRFPMYEADFGYGKPILSTYNSVHSTPQSGYATIMPPRPGSDYQAAVHFVLAPEMMQALLDNTEFRSFFH